MKRNVKLVALCQLVWMLWLQSPGLLLGQDSTIKKSLTLAPRAAKDSEPVYHLLPSEEEQETGNAVPVLLRIVYEQQPFMKDVYPKLHEFAEMDAADPRLQELHFDRFANQIIRAGSMSFADWQYPLRSEQPTLILLPDLQSQRQLVGRGMTAWIKQRLAKGDVDNALAGIKAQLGCGRHCAATPVIVCHLVGLSLASAAFDNLERALKFEEVPNMYWALAALPPTLEDLGPMMRWELWASPSRIDEPLPPIGDASWKQLANKFVNAYAESSSEQYTPQEAEALKKNIERLAQEELPKAYEFSQADMQRMTPEERVMRWIYLGYCRLRTQLEPLANQAPSQVIEAQRAIEASKKQILAATGAKSMPYPIALTQGVLACRNFERRVKFLQTIESIRDYTSKHDGRFPPDLDALELPAPHDPFTGKPFLFENLGQTARLQQTEIEGLTIATFDYELTSR